MSLISAYSLSTQDWLSGPDSLGLTKHTLPFFLDGLYRDRSVWDRHISKKILSSLELSYDFNLPKVAQLQTSTDGTVKFQMNFSDGVAVESVLIPFHNSYTICLSTQAGCAMNCTFCYTGTQGLKRNLTAGEIVGQYVVAKDWLLTRSPKASRPKVVFMGQGEPLQNFTEVKKAIEILNAPECLGVGYRQMTLSTVGFLPGLLKINQELFPPVNIALSLHSPFEEQRNELIPVNHRYPLNKVLTVLDQRTLLPRQFITFEYLLIKNFNMSSLHADALFHLLKERKAIVNLIPFNPFPGSKWERPSTEEIQLFKQELVNRKIRVLIRTTKGLDILAACGQLKINTPARSYGV
jgi:23S rRNA (adenine2503-C2)-methyltransferase